MDVVFDIDGTLADASHRLPYITNPEQPKNWDAFFKQMHKDQPIPEIWEVLTSLLYGQHRVIFITGRPERTRKISYNWLVNLSCPHRAEAFMYWDRCPSSRKPALYMRKDNDRRASSLVKQELLAKARDDGFDPKIAFEDRAEDAKMWRQEGLICCQAAEGNF